MEDSSQIKDTQQCGPVEISRNISCGCKTGCKAACTCVKNGMKCTAVCKCYYADEEYCNKTEVDCDVRRTW